MTPQIASPPTPAWRLLAVVTALVVLAHGALLVSLADRGIPAQPLPLENRFLTRTVVLAPPAAPAAPAPANPPPAVKRPAAKAAPAAAPKRIVPPRPARAPIPIPTPAEPTPAPVLSAHDDTAEHARAEDEDETPPGGTSAAVQEPGILGGSAGGQGPGGGGDPGAGGGELPGTGQPMQVHASARLRFEMLGQRGVQPWRGVFGELVWLQDGNEYNARLSLKMLFKTIRSQTSVGRIDANGIAPSRFSETRSSEVASHLVREEGKVVFSNNAPSVPLLPGAQDRLSVVMQLGALLAADAARYPEGSRIGIQTVGPRDAGVWTFVVEGSERLTVPAGEFEVRRLSRAPRSEQDYKLELWLAPELGWLPARMRQTQQDGDVIDLQLRDVSPP